MERLERINQQSAQLIRIENSESKVLFEGTRKECWQNKVQGISRSFTRLANDIVILKR